MIISVNVNTSVDVIVNLNVNVNANANADISTTVTIVKQISKTEGEKRFVKKKTDPEWLLSFGAWQAVLGSSDVRFVIQGWRPKDARRQT